MKLFEVYALYDLCPVRGLGAYVYDEHDKAYLDFYGGHAVISIGHSHPHYVERITNQLSRLAFYSNAVQNPLQEELAAKLGQLSGCDEYQLFLCNSGAEANENALKLASFHTGKTKVIAFNRAFHGRTSAAVHVTDNPSIVAPINRGFEVVFCDWEDLNTVTQHLAGGDVCAVIIEGIQGIGGIYVPGPEFLQELAQRCQHYGVVLILDEVQSGYGRSGKFFAFQHAGIEPDLITTAKGMGNGFPIGSVLIHPKFKAKIGLLGTTFGGSHLACAAALGVLEVIEKENLVENAEATGQYLISQLKEIEGVKEVRGQGLMIGLSFDFPTGPLRKHMLFEEDVFTGSASQSNVVRLLPPLCVGKAEADLLTSKLQASLAAVANPMTT